MEREKHVTTYYSKNKHHTYDQEKITKKSRKLVERVEREDEDNKEKEQDFINTNPYNYDEPRRDPSEGRPIKRGMCKLVGDPTYFSAYSYG